MNEKLSRKIKNHKRECEKFPIVVRPAQPHHKLYCCWDSRSRGDRRVGRCSRTSIQAQSRRTQLRSSGTCFVRARLSSTSTESESDKISRRRRFDAVCLQKFIGTRCVQPDQSDGTVHFDDARALFYSCISQRKQNTENTDQRRNAEKVKILSRRQTAKQVLVFGDPI